MDVQVMKLARKLGQAHWTYPLFSDEVWAQVRACVRACVRVLYASSKITSIISSSTRCKNLLDEVVMEIKNYCLAIWKFGSLWWCYRGWRHIIFIGLWNSYSRSEIWERNHKSISWINNWGVWDVKSLTAKLIAWSCLTIRLEVVFFYLNKILQLDSNPQPFSL